MKKREEVTARTRQNIMDAFWALYCEKRIEKITVKDVANKAGYNRGTFYEYFNDVYDVLESIENSLIPAADELPPLPGAAGLTGMPLELFFDIYERNKKYYSVLLGEKGDPAFAGKLKNTVKPVVMQIYAGKPNVDKRELEYVLEYTLSAMIGIMDFWLKQTNPYTIAELHELISRLTEQGVVKQLPSPVI